MQIIWGLLETSTVNIDNIMKNIELFPKILYFTPPTNSSMHANRFLHCGFPEDFLSLLWLILSLQHCNLLRYNVEFIQYINNISSNNLHTSDWFLHHGIWRKYMKISSCTSVVTRKLKVIGNYSELYYLSHLRWGSIFNKYMWIKRRLLITIK